MPDQPVDPERPRPDAHATKPFDRPDGYSGQDYTIGRELAGGARAAEPAFRPAIGDKDLPPESGQRATADPVTGEVHGSGIGIGGGNPGEDLDSSTPSGDTYPLTGGEGTDKTPGDLGPKNDEASYL